MAGSGGCAILSHVKTIVQFNVSQEDGAYTADGVNVPIVTEGASFEELQENIRDAVALYFEGNDPSSLGFAGLPSILTNFEVSPPLYAGRT
jgi:predicted RNase H-like HicB family nuclease